ncbi:GntR family transcriptional regulator [Bacillus sp. JJ1566]|uniref:GntR family transcriptional regulator n=1 Tax=Bacillus sp. JJ1566 TaxID=3122961 RepID=UPI002FFE39D2
MEWLESAQESPLKKTVLRDHVKNFILDAIINGNLQPGDRIVETQIAKSLGISQGPVREALRELEKTGVLHSEPYRGSFVKELSEKEITERSIVRASLEETAIRLAIARVTKDDINKLREIINEMVNSAKAVDAAKSIAFNVEFHRKIVELSGNEFLLAMWEDIHPNTWTTITTHVVKKELVELAERHNEVLDSIISGDPDIAVKVIRQHIVGLTSTTP